MLIEAIQQSIHVVEVICIRALPVIFIVALLQEYGLLRYIESFAGKVVNRTAFGMETGQAFIANAGSAYAGGGILVDMYRKGSISRANLVLSVVFAGFPAYVRVLITSVGPVAFTLLSFPVALFYICFSLASGACNMLVAGALSHRFVKADDKISEESKNNSAAEPRTIPKDHLRIAMTALKQSARYTIKMAIYVTVITSVVFYLFIMMILDWQRFAPSILIQKDTEKIVITAEDIEKMNAADIFDLLNHVPGIESGESSVRIRGFYDVQVLMEMDCLCRQEHGLQA